VYEMIAHALVFDQRCIEGPPSPHALCRVAPKTAWQNCIPNCPRTDGACLPWCPPRVWVHPTEGASSFVHASHGVLHVDGRRYMPPDLKMCCIQQTRVLVRDSFGPNWTAVSSNPDENCVKTTPSTRYSIVLDTTLVKIHIKKQLSTTVTADRHI
jgi:hypothetical protein